MTHEQYSSGGIDCDQLLEPEWSDPPTEADDQPIIIHDSDSSVSSDSGSSDSNEPISRKARKLAIQKAKKPKQHNQKATLENFLPLFPQQCT
jgi:hypothetical protein